MGVPSHHPFDFGIFHSKPSILIHFGDPFMETSIVSPASGHLRQVDAVINALSDGKSGEQRLEELRQTRIASVEHQAGSAADAKMDRNRRYNSLKQPVGEIGMGIP